MNKELNKRLFTSVILIFLLFLMLQYSVVLISSLLLIFVISWIEINSIFEKIFNKNRNKNLQKFFIKFIIFLYLLFFIKIVVDEFLQNQPNVSWNLIFIITICILTDIGGYIFGKTFKGKKLTKISPNKTYSGMFGSFLFTILFSLIYSYSISFIDLEIILFTSIVISAISQIGDLFISYLKRKAKLKDSGNILPGHGGLLDRIDGILFALPLGLIIINLIY